MQKLVKGVRKFQQEMFGPRRELFERLALKQEPDTLFITCSDSRINPAMLTQSEPGEIFIIRNAGNMIPAYGAVGSGEAATVEFAVAGLGVKDIIVCGHSHCGAMKALLNPSLTGDLPAMRKWLEHAENTRRVVRENYEGKDDKELLNISIQENVLAQLDNLRTHPTVAARLARGTVRLHAWVYKLETGEVFAYDVQEGQFKALSNAENIRPLAALHDGRAAS